MSSPIPMLKNSITIYVPYETIEWEDGICGQFELELETFYQENSNSFNLLKEEGDYEYLEGGLFDYISTSTMLLSIGLSQDGDIYLVISNISLNYSSFLEEVDKLVSFLYSKKMDPHLVLSPWGMPIPVKTISQYRKQIYKCYEWDNE